MHHSVDMRSQHPDSQENENLLFCSKDIKCPPKNKGISKWGWGLNLSSMLLLHLQLLKITLIGTNFKIAPAECSGCWLLSTRTVSTTAAQTRLQHIKMYSKEEGSKCCFLELFWKRNLKIASAINTQSLNHCGLLFTQEYLKRTNSPSSPLWLFTQMKYYTHTKKEMKHAVVMMAVPQKGMIWY